MVIPTENLKDILNINNTNTVPVDEEECKLVQTKTLISSVSKENEGQQSSSVSTDKVQYVRAVSYVWKNANLSVSTQSLLISCHPPSADGAMSLMGIGI